MRASFAPFDGVLRLRRRGRTLLVRLVLKGQRPLPEQHHGKAVDEPVERVGQRLAFERHGVIHRGVERAVAQLVHAAAEAVLQKRLDNQLGNISPDVRPSIAYKYKVCAPTRSARRLKSAAPSKAAVIASSHSAPR